MQMTCDLHFVGLVEIGLWDRVRLIDQIDQSM